MRLDGVSHRNTYRRDRQMIEIDYTQSILCRCYVRIREVRVYEYHQQYHTRNMYERCHQRYYSTFNDATSYQIRCFILLASIFASTGRYLPIYWNNCYEHYNAVTPHALRARVVIVYWYILVRVRAHILCIIFIKLFDT